MEDYNIFIAFDSLVPDLWAMDDNWLMLVFMDAEVDQELLKWLNWCRMYLHVMTLTDILTPDRRHLRQLIWDGHWDDQL